MQIDADRFPEGLLVLAHLMARRQRAANGCWLWDGAKSGAGYAQVWDGARVAYVHRLSAILFHDLSEDSGLCVLHTCDNPNCWNPEHLWLGTHAENMRDAAIKGRIKRKLAPEDVLDIKRLLKQGVSHAEIARRYGVSKATIGQIARGKTWQHVTLEEESEESAP